MITQQKKDLIVTKKNRLRHQKLSNKSIFSACLLSFFALLFLLHFIPSSPALLIFLPLLSGLLFLSLPPIFPSQWDLPAGVKAAGHLITAASVPERDQRWERPHRREQPALLLQHSQLDKTFSRGKPEGSGPQQPRPSRVL